MKYKCLPGFGVFQIIESGMHSATALVRQAPEKGSELFYTGDVVIVKDDDSVPLPDRSVLLPSDAVLAVLVEGETEEEQELLDELKDEK